MDNPDLVLTTLDSHLDHPVSLVLYGRASIHLGFDNPPPVVGRTKDVDGILRLAQMEQLVNDDGFWDAIEATNRELEPHGLYITHLFGEEQVMLRRQWEQHIIPITRLDLKWLQLARPATIDLLLTKMMRGGDEQDMEDAKFLIEHDHITRTQIQQAFNEVRGPEHETLWEVFEKAKPLVLAMAYDS